MLQRFSHLPKQPAFHPRSTSFATAAGILGAVMVFVTAGVLTLFAGGNASAESPRMLPANPADDAFQIRDDIPVTAYPDIGYDQDHRPQFHFTSKRHWLNDPNGLVHDGEKYHLFFQHNPLGNQWGNMTWGHAVSKDMLRWTQQPHALLPYRVDGREGTIFSGTAIIDHLDSLEKRDGEISTLASFFTFAAEPSFYQAMAFSVDRGETWTLHNNGRAVVANQGLHPEERDPKVFWHGPTQRWGMVLWVDRDEATKVGTLRFFESEDLTHWKKVCDVRRGWAYECPDIFFGTVDGKGRPKTVLYDASGDYEIGVYDGKTFTSETGPLKFGEEGSLYASQIFNNQPQFRVIQMSWIRPSPAVEALDLPFAGQMSFPIELKLVGTDVGPRLSAQPIREIRSLIAGEHRFDNLMLSETPQTVGPASPPQWDIDVSLRSGDAKQITIGIAGIDLRYRRDGGVLAMANGASEVTLMKDLRPVEGVVDLRIMVDRLSVEVFADGGKRFTAVNAVTETQPQSVRFSADGVAATVSGVLREVMSVWQPTE